MDKLLPTAVAIWLVLSPALALEPVGELVTVENVYTTDCDAVLRSAGLLPASRFDTRTADRRDSGAGSPACNPLRLNLELIEASHGVWYEKIQSKKYEVRSAV